MPKAPKAEAGVQPAKPVQRRSALACLPCRSAKNKCDGLAPPLAVEISASQALKASPSDDIPSETPCTRCTRLDLRCMWQPSHRTGRPRKKRETEQGPSTGSIGTTLDGLPALHTPPRQQATSSSFSPSSIQTPGCTNPAVDITGHDILELFNRSPHDSTESLYSTLDADHHDELGPSLADEMAELGVTSSLQPPPADDVVAAWSAAVSPSVTLVDPAAGALPPPYLFGSGSEHESQERASKRARDQFSMLRSRIEFDIRQERAVDTSSPSLWPELPPQFQGHESDLQRGLRLYFTGFGLSVPILGEEQNFFAARFVQVPELSPSPLVLHAAATLGLLLEEGKDAVSVDLMRTRTRELADVTVEQSKAMYDTDLARMLSAIQGLILVAHDDYGRTQIPAAARYMRAACDLALRSQLNWLDSGRMYEAAHGGELSRSSTRPVSFAGIGLSRSFTQDFLEDCRRTWWELYISDLMFHMTTSGKLQRTLIDPQMVVAVNSPKDLGDPEQRSEAYNIRIRAAALINECTRPPADPRNPDLGRLHAIDTMLSNLLLQGQAVWASVAANASNPGLHMRPTPAVQTKLEIIFTALIVMHAARIHLHRQAWFSDLQMDLESCSFKPMAGTVERAPPSGHQSGLSILSDEARRDYVASSVSTIVSCSDGILRLIRLDAEMHMDLALMRPSTAGAPPPPSSPVPPHWPFFACCSMVASFGYAVAVAASGPEHSALPSFRDEIRLRMGDGRTSFGASAAVPSVDYSFHGISEPTMDSIIAGWGAAQSSYESQAQSQLQPHTSTSSAAAQYELVQEQKRRDEEAYIWKTRAALSNISFAETTLSLYATVWPMAAVYQAEVHKCKSAVDLGGPMGLGSSMP